MGKARDWVRGQDPRTVARREKSATNFSAYLLASNTPTEPGPPPMPKRGR